MSMIRKFPHISGIVLGGGQSKRMGRDKRSLLWDGEIFLDRICCLMNRLFGEVLVVTAQEDYDCSHLPVRLVTDIFPGKGSLGGLYTGLIEANNFLSFVVACDMPFVKPDSVSRLCLEPENDILVVKLCTGIQPLHARYSKRCAPIIEGMISTGNLKIQNLLSDSGLNIRILNENFFNEIDPCLESFDNINTPADLEFAKKRAFPQNKPE